MKKLTTIVLVLVIGIIFSTAAFGKDMKTTQATKPAAPVIHNLITGNNNPQFPHDIPSEILVYASGATSIDQTYKFYYTDYNNDERQKNWKWLKENGKILTAKPFAETVLYTQAKLKVNEYGKQQVFTVTIIDKNGNESDPAPIRVF